MKIAYFQRETRELVNLDSCELIRSQFGLLSSFEAGVALDYLAEIADQLLPPGEANERFYRLLAAVLEHMRSGEPGAVWRAVTYFSLWAVRLAGLLPDLGVCLGCGNWLADPESPQKAFFTRGRTGLLCAACRAALGLTGCWELSSESRSAAEEMLRKPVSQVAGAGPEKSEAADLRHFLVRQIEDHIDRKLVTPPVLEAV